MVVYIVEGRWQFEEFTICGVYTTLELAQAAASELNTFDSVKITQYTVDE